MIHSPLSILLVEDEALVAMHLEAIIEEAGHHAAGWATSASEAETIVKALPKRPDLAFVDVRLADDSLGTDVAERLRQRDIAVVFMTANPKRLREDMNGAIGVVAKPYSSTSVRAVLHYLHRGMRSPPPASALPVGLRLSPPFVRDWACRDSGALQIG